uniref:Uncharacterized protein n=1 Tax=Odontella aurita TaxID=265563 RepID=A0A7S4JEB6_9STRA|mmetsp:Transcript_44849/g.136968  ORF Transcript_44849/g.136968 Transcript_44849/m.136968 type:complete len:405 (+) Transcript_44849:200-1414(+)
MSDAEAAAATDDAASNFVGAERVYTPIPGVTPTVFTAACFSVLALYVVYLLLPRGVRVDKFGSYPKRYRWSDRTLRARDRRRRGLPPHGNYGPSPSAAGSASVGTAGGARSLEGPGFGLQDGARRGSAGPASSGAGAGAVHLTGDIPPRDEASLLSTPPGGGSSLISAGTGPTTSASLQSYGGGGGGAPSPYRRLGAQGIGVQQGGWGGVGSASGSGGGVGSSGAKSVASLIDNENEVYVSATMQQLRDPGVQLVAHGSKGKPKRVRLRLTVDCIAWRTEIAKKGGGGELKLGKLHRVPLAHILYVDVGKQTTALRRVENASVPDGTCFSLLTRDGSLDLEATSARERDALVSCFSLVLDEVHAKDWRDVAGRAPSPSEMVSSFDEGDNGGGGGGSRNDVELEV